MQDGNRQRYFFVGIGGSGMQPLAMIARARGAEVWGSDRGLDQGRRGAKFDALEAAGVRLFPQDGSGVTSREQVVVASAAVEDSVPDMAAAIRLGCTRLTRAELNAQLFNAAACSIGVAGTSGKSTVTGMLATILAAVGRDPTVMNGAVMKAFGASQLVGDGDAYVSEVDESDGSIALYTPRIAVVTNVSLDHKELDELNALFADFLGKAAHAVVNADNPDAAALALRLPRERVTTFSVEGSGDLVATDLTPEPFAIGFSLGDVRVRLAVPGRHNVANALAALAAALAAGVPLAEGAAALAGFTGLGRRFELVGEAGGVSVLDDFGHNPDKIAATLDTLHAFPGRLLLLFQPHGYGPLKVMRAELAAMFAARLGAEDVLVLPDPVYHGGTVARAVTSADVVRDIAVSGRQALHLADRDAAAAHLVGLAQPGDRIVVMGARDDSLSQLAAAMLEKFRARG